MPELTPTIAIVGSGPAGCYSAQFLKKSMPGAEITVFEALPVPYGLLRYGVAADHQGTKNISAQFERLFTHSGVRFMGNVEIGRDLSVDELMAAFDVVVFAIGLSSDRKLGIPGDDQENVIGAGKLLRALNSYPKKGVNSQDVIRPLGERVVVIGNGNVAMDIVRLIAKSEDELIGSDVDDNLRLELCTSNVKRIDVVGRSPIDAAKFDLAMLREICHLKGATVNWLNKALDIHCPAADLLLSTEAASSSVSSSVEINFRFNARPLLISSRNQAAVLTLGLNDGDSVEDLEYDTVITAVGFCREESDQLALTPGSYPVGWARRGPKGTVAENRRDAAEVAALIVENWHSGHQSVGKPGLEAIEHLITHKAVSFEQWKRLDRHEIHSAAPGRCRKKTTSITEMLSVMDDHVPVAK
ncbi:FAD-dependent oxidoreductase [Pectobacterium punjabense]|uniref:FAD-dependent oxidoreductase n=1 Tax=Pectobacterium punjabense TaxID=2108399 RepID=UPI001968D87A|nr:FAD-dependent oxidoreductase [Pectobacterium punjabense]MBN3137519.1 FAD-dependent oxidoreductase [Pectobacterium punjabense]MCE5380533.1 FAD-dependent oxidoreductase [Pectobacterium punjabense]